MQSRRKPTDLVQSVARALQIVEVVAASDSPMTAQEIAKALDLHLATTSHLLSTLVYCGLLDRWARSYRLSRAKSFEYYSRASKELGVKPEYQAMLNAVVAATGETAFISTWANDDVVIQAVAEGSHALRVTDLHIGTGGHVHARASGKVLLAFGPDELLTRYLASGSAQLPRTPHTITDPVALREDLAATRERGYAIDRQEYALGVVGLAVPIFEGTRWPATSLALTAPASRLGDEALDRSIGLLRSVAEQFGDEWASADADD